MDIAGLLPKYINIRRGAYVGLIISIALCPWQLLSSAATFISVLSAYSVFLGPMAGIMICDYWVVRRGRVKLSDLYHGREEGVYFSGGGLIGGVLRLGLWVGAIFCRGSSRLSRRGWMFRLRARIFTIWLSRWGLRLVLLFIGG